MDLFYLVAVVLFVLWVVGLVSSCAMNGFIHVLLVAAVISVLVRVIRGRKLLG